MNQYEVNFLRFFGATDWEGVKMDEEFKFSSKGGGRYCLPALYMRVYKGFFEKNRSINSLL